MNLAEAKQLGLNYGTRKRVGRGTGSGLGKTSGRGHKGAQARTGWKARVGWEGGQMPLFRRLPKRGFNNKNFRRSFTTINVEDLDKFETGAVVDLKAVLERGITSKTRHTELFKILGDGQVTRSVTVRVDAITKSAQATIEAAGGRVEMLPKVDRRPKFVRKGQSEPTPKRIRIQKKR